MRSILTSYEIFFNPCYKGHRSICCKNMQLFNIWNDWEIYWYFSSAEYLFLICSWLVNCYWELMNLIARALFNCLNCSSWHTAVCNVGCRNKLIIWQNVNYLHFPPLSLNNLFIAAPFTIPQPLPTKCLYTEWWSCSPEHWVFLLQSWADLSSLCKVVSNSIQSRAKGNFFPPSLNIILYKLLHTSGYANVMLQPLKDLCVCGKSKNYVFLHFIILVEKS